MHLSEFRCVSLARVIDEGRVSSCRLPVEWPSRLFSHLTQTLNGLIGSIRAPSVKVLSNS